MKLHVLVALVALVGCDKGNGTATTSQSAQEVKLSPDEAALLASLPAGNQMLFGGNYLRFQKYLADSPLNRLMGPVMQSAGASGAAMTEWMNCFVEVKIQMLGGVKFDAGHAAMSFVMSGMDLSQLEACAKRAGFPNSMDADHKFLGIEFPNNLQGPMKGGYLAIAGGMVYTRMTMTVPAITAIPIDRAALEGDIASVAKTGSAATDKALVSQIAEVDRSKAIWFVGNAAGTPVADKLGTAHGTFDIGDGIAMDVTAQVLDQALADKIADGVQDLKRRAGSQGGLFHTLVEQLEFHRVGDRLHMQIAIDNAQLQAIVDQLAPFMPATAAH